MENTGGGLKPWKKEVREGEKRKEASEKKQPGGRLVLQGGRKGRKDIRFKKTGDSC